jgi:two-component system cell cycle response regulator
MTENHEVNVLIVDDRKENLLALEGWLDLPDIHIIKAASGTQALELLLEYDTALVLLDVQMPDMDGFETAEYMRKKKRTRNIPIIFLTAISKEEQHIFKGYETGAVDYLFKPVDPHVLKSKVSVFIEMYRQKKALVENARELEQANQKILQQQESLIKEERVKVLLQLAGATAHELNQPLTGLLGYLDLLEMYKTQPEKIFTYVDKIRESGLRISKIVNKIQTIRDYDTKPYLSENAIIDIDQKTKILSVGNKNGDFEALCAQLNTRTDILIMAAKGIEEAISRMEVSPFGLIVSEYILPDGDVFEFMKALDKKGFDTPLVVITGHGNELVASELIQTGVYDYLLKSKIDEEIFIGAVKRAMEKAQLKKELVVAQKRMVEMAIKDELTGLYNRRYFLEALEREVSKADRYGADLALCMLDLDYFKDINDTYGHSAGDMVLSEIGKMFNTYNRFSDLVCRYGGEEFSVILPNTSLEKARVACDRFREFINDHKFEYQNKQFKISASIGVSCLTDTTNRVHHELIDCADKALYQAKEAGRNRVMVYSATQPDEL